MINKVSFFSIVSLSVTLAACSGNGNRVAGKQCSKRFDPIPMNIPAQSKVSLKPKNLPNGTYDLFRAQLYFKGNPTELSKDGFQVYLIEEPTKRPVAGSKSIAEAKELETKMAVDCFRNAKVNQEHSVSVEGISSLTVLNGVMTPTTKPYGFRMSTLGDFEIDKRKTLSQPGSVEKVFSSADETFVVSHGPDDFEVRSKGVGKNGTYFLSTFLHRVK